MTKHVLVLIVFLLGMLSTSSSFYAQVGFSLPSFTGTTTGQALDLPVTVVNFDTVYSIQFVIRWNPAVLELQSIGLIESNNPLFLIDSTHFNLTDADEGLIRFFWYNASFPKTFVDGKEIFRLKMKVVGPNGVLTPVEFGQIIPTTYFEVVSGPNNQVYTLATALLTQGSVIVGTISSQETVTSIQRLMVAPNPISTTAWVSFDLQESSSVCYRILDMTGRVLQEKDVWLDAGQQRLLIDASSIGYTGQFVLQLQNKSGISNSMIVVH